ncbi:coiled-coil domain-containing protein 25 isoform X4 [Corvus moneduloides]|uniref:coiled-coil domain-containing protein 25 isoform X4 n=1 Tax=Corvus moneduloides TaxID=1196302 RepID=UPI001361FE92|nr:coiled-coil domain-containing protein 25 isoform X4 [Corvus moneduloides]
MVFYFTSNAVAAVYTIYMGKDKYENEDLIKYGWPEDVWFHVDKLSSAHVYLRLHKGQTMDDIPKEVLSDCAHLVKANSIQGCKLSSVTVVYTPWSNLRKTPDMDVGQIGFHRQKDVRSLTVVFPFPNSHIPKFPFPLPRCAR